MTRICVKSDPAKLSAPNEPFTPANDNGFNPQDYKEDLGVETLSAEQGELLRALWHIMCSFVDLGWGVDNVSNFLPDLFAVDNLEEPGSHAIPPRDSVEEQSKNKD